MLGDDCMKESAPLRKDRSTAGRATVGSNRKWSTFGKELWWGSFDLQNLAIIIPTNRRHSSAVDFAIPGQSRDSTRNLEGSGDLH